MLKRLTIIISHHPCPFPPCGGKYSFRISCVLLQYRGGATRNTASAFFHNIRHVSYFPPLHHCWVLLWGRGCKFIAIYSVHGFHLILVTEGALFQIFRLVPIWCCVSLSGGTRFPIGGNFGGDVTDVQLIVVIVVGEEVGVSLGTN